MTLSFLEAQPLRNPGGASGEKDEERADQAIVGKPLDNDDRDRDYALWFDTAKQVRFEIGSGTNKSAKLPSAVALDSNWHYLAATFSSGALKLYIDGNLSSSMTASGFTTAGANATSTGKGRPGDYRLASLSSHDPTTTDQNSGCARKPSDS